MSITEQRDWHAWHTDYEDASSDLSRRLEVVQAEIRKVLPPAPGAEFTVLSICAGQAHDIIGVLSEYSHADNVKARLVELELLDETSASWTALADYLLSAQPELGQDAQTVSIVLDAPIASLRAAVDALEKAETTISATEKVVRRFIEANQNFCSRN